MASMTRTEILKPEDFEAIREAVMETPRGRWFLEQFAARVRGTEGAAMLDAMRRLESAVASNHDSVMATLGRALANAAPPAAPQALQPQAPAPQPDIAPRHMKFFRQDEDIFEPAPQAAIAAVPEAARPAPKTEAPKGAKVIIRRAETVSMETIPEPPAPQPAAAVAEPAPAAAVQAPMPEPVPPPAEAAPQPAAEAQPKRRIVIIRHKPGEDIDVPLQHDVARAS